MVMVIVSRATTAATEESICRRRYACGRPRISVPLPRRLFLPACYDLFRQRRRFSLTSERAARLARC